MVKPVHSFSWNREWLWGFLLAAATLFAYQPAWNGQPVWDDNAHMTGPELRSVAGLWRIWTQIEATQQYYPLVHTVFWVEHRLFGDATPGYHLLNIFLHLLSALIFVRILKKTGIPGAWFAGGIFALHPVMVESVAWISELKNTLSGVFFLSAAFMYLKFDGTREKKHYFIAIILFLSGLLSKSVIATLPAVLLVVFWWMRGRVAWKRDVVPLLPFFAIGIMAGLFTAWVERRYIGAEGAAFDFTFLDRCLIAGRAVWFYLYKILWPANLLFMYPRWHIDPAEGWQYLFPAAFLLATALFWKWRKRSRAPLAVLLYFTGMLFPALGFFNVYPFRYSFVADHFQYLAAAGPIAAAAALIVQGTGFLKEHLRRPARPLLYGLLLSVLFLLTWRQCNRYTDAETLYRTTVARNDCWWAHTHLGVLLANRGLLDEAMVHLQRAWELDSNSVKTHNNLGNLFAKTGQTGAALAHFRKALELDPDFAEAHNNLGVLLARTGQHDEAMAHYRKALKLQPNYTNACSNIGILLARTGRLEEALDYFLKAVEINPYSGEVHYHLSVLLAQMGRTEEAMMYYRKALKLQPKSARLP